MLLRAAVSPESGHSQPASLYFGVGPLSGPPTLAGSMQAIRKEGADQTILRP